jgi:hypothetical protein
MGDIIEGKLTKKGQIYIQSIVEQCDMRSGKVIWMMRKSRFEQMKREGWTLELIRYDLQETSESYILFEDPRKAILILSYLLYSRLSCTMERSEENSVFFVIHIMISVAE